jgi:hypothetical protein
MLAACNLNHRLGAKQGVESLPGYALSPLSLSLNILEQRSPSTLRPFAIFKAIYIYLPLPLLFAIPPPHVATLP